MKLKFSAIGMLVLTAYFPSLAEARTTDSGAVLIPEQQVDSQDAGLKKLITVNLQSLSLEESLEEVSRVSGLKFRYSEDVLSNQKKVSYRANRRPVSEVIAVVISGTGLTFRQVSGSDILIEKPNSDSVETRSGIVAGVITDSTTGKPLAGATVQIRALNLTIVTGERGQFMLRNVPSGNHMLEVRGVGYKSFSTSVAVQNAKRTVVNTGLTQAGTTLNEIVTTVTGMQRKIEIGNDVTTINADSVLKTAPITSVSDLLEGRVPGLTVTRTSGAPGAPSRIRLRGIGGGLMRGVEGSATNDPIVIVDGIRINATQSGVTDQNLAGDVQPGSTQRYNSQYAPPSAIDQIDPNSIERIDVYKGPSAAALYGSDAANGVIVITTKKGRSGSTRWSATISQGIEYLPGSYAPPGYFVFCSSQGIGSRKPDICDALSNLDLMNIDSTVRFQALNIKSLDQFSTGNRGERSVNVSGGQGPYSYSVTGSMSDHIGSLKMPSLYQNQYKALYDSAPAQWMRRPNKMNTDGISASFSFAPRSNFDVTFSGRLSNSKQAQTSGQFDISRLAGEYIDTLTIDPRVVGDYSTKVNANRSGADYSASFRWVPFSFLPTTATIGTSRDNRKDTRFIPYGVLRSLSADLEGFYSMGTAIQDTRTARVNTTLFPGWKVSTALGVEITKNERSQFQGSNDSVGQGIILPSAFTDATQSYTRSTTGGWFLEPRLNLNSRFFVNPGFRLDGNTLSGSKGGLWSLFPRLNFSWIAIDGNEDFSGPLRVISLFRPRVSFGVAGVQPAPGWQLRLLSSINQGSPDSDGLQVGTIGNSDLHPERTREIEAGFELELFDGKYDIIFSRFSKLRSDAIESIQLPHSVYGPINQYVNIGKIRNTGVEVSVSATLLDNSFLTWQVNSSISKYDNKLLKLNSEEAYIDLGNGSRYMEGYPLNGRWERPIVGFAPNPTGFLKRSDILIADSAVYVGQQAANFDLPFSTNLTLLKGAMALNFSFHYKDGMTQFNQGGQQHLISMYFKPNATPAEQAIALAAMACNQSIASQGCSRYGLVQNVNTLRFSNMSVSYNIPRDYTQSLRIPSIQLSLQGSNLGLWTGYRGKDPDVNSNTVGEATVDNGQIPQQRTWRIQARLGN